MFSAADSYCISNLNTLPISNYKSQRHCRLPLILLCQTSKSDILHTLSLSPNKIFHITPSKKKVLKENYNDYNGHGESKNEEIMDILQGKLLRGGLVYQQNLLIKSYELGPDGKATMGAILNHLQEVAINHFKSCGLAAEGFGSTSEMTRRNLIWVVYKLQAEVNRYPSWADIIQIKTWTSASGKNGKRRDWIIYDYKTGEVLIQAVSLYVIMNKETRRLSKFMDEIREEIKPHFMDCDPIIKEDNIKIPKLDVASADYVRTGLLSGWSDLDLNQHVNHVKYINWIIESTPRSVLENQWLSKLTLEYRKECGADSSLQSLSAVVQSQDIDQNHERHVELHHSLCLDNGSELVRGRTVWKPSPKKL